MAHLIQKICLAYIVNSSKWEKWRVIQKHAQSVAGKQTIALFSFVNKQPLSNLFTFLYRPPPVDMGSPSPRLLPKCKSQCVGRDKNQLESEDAPYFQFPPTEKEFDNICATSETPTSSSK